LVLFTTAAWLPGGPLWSDLQKWGSGWFVAYLGNIRAAWVNAFPPIFSFVPLWSLQVEEQFYLLYPLVVLRLSRQNLRRFLLGCAVAAPLVRISLLWRVLTYTGRIAYGLYLLHSPASWVARKLVMMIFGMEVAGHSATSVAVTFLASFLAAGVSWRYFESPILAFKVQSQTRVSANVS